MHILAPSSESILHTRILGHEFAHSIEEIPWSGRFDGYPWDDATGPAREFVVDVPGLREGGPDGILEVYSRSSQFDRLRGWNGSAVWGLAVAGDGFHGQYGRTWHTGPGNLHLSLAIPVDLPIEAAVDLQRKLAQILAELLSTRTVIARVKAPNDVVICRKLRHGVSTPKKVAGTLTELRAAGERIIQVRYGIGLNLRYAPPVHGRGKLRAAALCHYRTGKRPYYEDGVERRKCDDNNDVFFGAIFFEILSKLIHRLNTTGRE